MTLGPTILRMAIGGGRRRRASVCAVSTKLGTPTAAPTYAHRATSHGRVADA